MKKIAEGTTVMKNYEVYELSGTVKSETTRSETSVSGHVPSRNSNMAGNISSRTTTFQTIYLNGNDGKEHAAELVDLIIPCTEGHKLTLWAVNGSAWFEGKNHTTEQHVSSKIPLTSFTMPFTTMKRAMYIFDIMLFVFFVGFLIENLEFIDVILSAMGAAFLGGIFYLLLLIPAKVVSMMRTAHILSAKNQHASA